MVNLKSQEP